MPQERGIGTARLQQRLGDLIHLLETVVAEDDVQGVIGVDERARHVVERHLQVPVHDGRLVNGQVIVGHGEGCIMSESGPSDAVILAQEPTAQISICARSTGAVTRVSAPCAASQASAAASLASMASSFWLGS